jgi:hypothetical protein
MSEFITTFIKKTSPQFKKYKAYIEKNNWVNMTV